MKDYKEITSKEARTIIKTRKPLGVFWLKENGWYVAIDNRTSDAWTENFRTKEECFNYLNRSEPMQSFSE